MYDQIGDLLLRQDHQLLDAIKVVESSRLQMAFVLNDSDVLVGVLTNGDIRRFLLRGGSMTNLVSECMNREYR